MITFGGFRRPPCANSCHHNKLAVERAKKFWTQRRTGCSAYTKRRNENAASFFIIPSDLSRPPNSQLKSCNFTEQTHPEYVQKQGTRIGGFDVLPHSRPRLSRALRICIEPSTHDPEPVSLFATRATPSPPSAASQYHTKTKRSHRARPKTAPTPPKHRFPRPASLFFDETNPPSS